jgi:pyruvate dehydrogenase E2 component (dihydrolipoamide acetyltransferase)
MSDQVFLLPDVGEGLIEADVVTWKVRVGDHVSLNQPVVDVETAKAVVELPSPFTGVVTALHASEGDTLSVGSPLLTVAADPSAQELQQAVLIGYGAVNDDVPVVGRRRRASLRAGDPTTPKSGVRAAPPVRLVAKTLGVDLTTVTPTGPDGIITRDDVRQSLQPREALSSGPRDSTSWFMGAPLASWHDGPLEERRRVRGVAKAMAETMTLSATIVPQATAFKRVDVTSTMRFLVRAKADPAYADVRLSPLTVVALAFCDAIRTYPAINSTFDSAANDVIIRRSVGLGIAAATPRGLVVPVIREADRLDTRGLGLALSALVTEARVGTTTPAAMTGATVTITNVGPLGIDTAVALLPPGTSAILCVGAVAPTPWVVNGALAIRDVVELSLTFDHRHIDGALASAVLAHIATFLHDGPPD